MSSATGATLVDFLWSRGELSVTEAALCVVGWLTLERGADHVTPRELRALYPRRQLPGDLPPLRSPAESLAAGARAELLEVVARGSYRITPLGLAVVLALPDRATVGALRRLSRAAPRPRASAKDGRFIAP